MRSLTLSAVLATFLWSAPVGGVSVLVKNSPITLYEIEQEMKQSGTNAKQSADTLIRKKLRDVLSRYSRTYPTLIPLVTRLGQPTPTKGRKRSAA